MISFSIFLIASMQKHFLHIGFISRNPVYLSVLGVCFVLVDSIPKALLLCLDFHDGDDIGPVLRRSVRIYTGQCLTHDF